MTKPFHCKNCYHTLGYRDCDKLIVDAIEIEFKRSHQVKCKECGCETAFRVTGKIGTEKPLDYANKIR